MFSKFSEDIQKKAKLRLETDLEGCLRDNPYLFGTKIHYITNIEPKKELKNNQPWLDRKEAAPYRLYKPEFPYNTEWWREQE